MTAPTLYCIDTSALIAGWGELYPIAQFPSLWDHMATLVGEGRLIAPVEVRNEIKRQDDALSKWLTGNKAMFVDVDEAIQVRQRAILTRHKRLVDTRKSHFSADPWVIALSLERGAHLITEEKPTNSPTKPHIPDVCRDPEFTCPCSGLLELIRREQWVYR